jgi:hypothetical protein
VCASFSHPRAQSAKRSATNTNHQVQPAITTPRREIEVRLICVEFNAHAATGSICRAEQKYHSDATPPQRLGGRARVWHSTAQHSTTQHSTAQRGLAEVWCVLGWVLAALGCRFFFFFAYAGLGRGLGDVAGFVSGGYLNTYLPLGWCRGVGLLALGRGLCCVCVCVWWGLWRDL